MALGLLFKMKTKTRYLLLCIVTISIISVGLIFLPPRWSYLILGVLAFIIGSVVLTEEWRTGKRVIAIVFIIAITVGGLLTTKGWNEWGNYSQKKALIVALAREWSLNELYTLGPPMSFDVNDPNLGEPHVMYPRFRTFAQESILISALFDLRNQKDNELLKAVISYNDTIEAFNTYLAWEDEYCANRNVGQQKRKELYIRVRDKSSLHIQFKRCHKELLNLLEKDYSWALDEARPTIEALKKKQE